MARDLTTCEPSWEWGEAAAFRWPRPHQRPEEEPGVVVRRDVGVDPFSLRHFSRVDIDRPLPIPSVSVHDRRRVVSPSSSTAAGGPKKPPAAPAWWEWDGAECARPTAHSTPSSAALAEAGFEVALMSAAAERKAPASEPQRWGSNVPLIAAADPEEECSFGGGKDGKQGKHAGNKAPFTCCMFVPELTRWAKPPTSSSTATAAAAARSSSSGNKFGSTTTTTAGNFTTMDDDDDAGTSCSAGRASTMAVSLERFDCGGLSTASSSPRGLGDGGEAASASSYFDLPVELILGCGDGAGDDADVPVCAAFLFDGDGVRKSVLKRRLEAAAGGGGWEPRRPSLGKVSVDASGWVSNPQVRVSVKSRSP